MFMYNSSSSAYVDDGLDFDEIDGLDNKAVNKIVKLNNYIDFDEIDGVNEFDDEEEIIEDIEPEFADYDSVWYVRLYDLIENLKNNIKDKINSFFVFIYHYIDGDYDVPVTDEEYEQEQVKLLKHQRKLRKLDNHEFWLRDHLAAVFETIFIIALFLVGYMLYLGDDSVVIWAVKTLMHYQ